MWAVLIILLSRIATINISICWEIFSFALELYGIHQFQDLKVVFLIIN